MRDHENQSSKEAKRVEKRAAEEAQLLAKEQVRQKREGKRTEKRAAEETKQSAKDRERKAAYLAKEQAIAKGQEARKLKAKE